MRTAVYLRGKKGRFSVAPSFQSIVKMYSHPTFPFMLAWKFLAPKKVCALVWQATLEKLNMENRI